MKKTVIIIGGGAAGFFAAINFAEKSPGHDVIILEKSNKVLSKVKVSGGGRCNVTNIISDPGELTKYYPRGRKELIGAFFRFSSGDTINWFETKGIKLKTEADGRVFPVTDNSQTIVDCLFSSAQAAGIKIITKANVKNLIPPSINSNKWTVETPEQMYFADAVLIAAGGSEQIWGILEKIGHKIESPVPSLFTFNIKDNRLKGLEGISFKNISVKVEDSLLKSGGDVLITHWGLSGPAILKLSAWGAREFAEKDYKFILFVNWINKSSEWVKTNLSTCKESYPNKTISTNPLFNLPARFWERLIFAAGIDSDLRWNNIPKSLTNNLINELVSAQFSVSGKSTFKEEFVTCGGINLKDVDFKTMQSKIFNGLFFAGEILDIDALTGGFNFQSAWTTAWIAANAI